MKGKIVNCFYDGAGGGLGDFMRGCVYLYGHCKSRGLDFDFDLSKHPINKYISSNCDIEYDVGYIDCLYNKAIEDKTSFLAGIKRLTEGVLAHTKDDETKLIYSNFHYYVQSGAKMISAMNSMPPLSRGCRNWFKDNINFDSKVNESVDKTLFKNKLKIGEFNIVHFRIGDQNSFGDKRNSENYFKICRERCSEISKNSNLPLIILSDSNELKEYLDGLDDNHHVFHLESQHTQSAPAQSGLDLSISEDGVFYVAFDAKLLTLAKKVYSYSVYTHGSGFVFWLCKIFGIDVEMNLLNMPKTKLPVFFHIPKNAGSYVLNKCSFFMRRVYNNTRHYRIDVLKEGVITYRLLCTSDKKLNEEVFKKINHVLHEVELEALVLDDINICLIVVSDNGLKNYKEEIYKFIEKDSNPYEFALLRETYSRTQSLYSYVQSNQSAHELYHNSYENMSFSDYLNSPKLEGGWLIKNLLGISDEDEITEENFNDACKILDKMFVYDVSEVEFCLEKMFRECFDLETSKIDTSRYNKYDNKTKDKIDTPFDCLCERTKTAFLNQTKWDDKLYERYVDISQT